MMAPLTSRSSICTKWMGGGGEISDHVNNVLVREAIKEILGNFGHRQKMGGVGSGTAKLFIKVR